MRSIGLSYIIIIFIVGTCASCRSVKEYRTSVDSTAVTRMDMIASSNSQKELKRILEKIQDEYTFIIRDTEEVRDSTGTVRRHSVEKILRNAKKSVRDSMAVAQKDSLYSEKSDSLVTKKSSAVMDKEKEAEKLPPAFFIYLFLFIAVAIYATAKGY